MHQNATGLEQTCEGLVANPQMIDPNRGIDEDQAGSGRRRGAFARSGSLPPMRASRRALSRSINALSASRMRADFSLRPVKACAFARSSSSRATLVRTTGFLCAIGMMIASLDALNQCAPASAGGTLCGTCGFNHIGAANRLEFPPDRGEGRAPFCPFVFSERQHFNLGLERPLLRQGLCFLPRDPSRRRKRRGPPPSAGAAPSVVSLKTWCRLQHAQHAGQPQ